MTTPAKPLTPEEQAASLARADAASPGPWRADMEISGAVCAVESLEHEVACGMYTNDAVFIAAAREDIQRWSATVEAIKAELRVALIDRGMYNDEDHEGLLTCSGCNRLVDAEYRFGSCGSKPEDCWVVAALALGVKP